MKLPVRTLAVGLGVASFAIAGCTGLEEDDTTATADGAATVFTCPDGETIEAVFPAAMGDEVAVTLPGQEAVMLPPVAAASGAKYSDGTTTFWEQGGEALVEIEGDIVLQGCTVE
jgi:putative lipoprotein